MKKITILIASLILLASVAKASYPSSKIDECKNEPKGSKRDICYLEIATRDVYSGQELEFNTSVCKKITASTWRQAQCYWGYAMNQKDLSICNLLPKSPEKIIVKFSPKHPDYDTAVSVRKYAYKDHCKKELRYVYKDAYWKRSEELLSDRYSIYEGKADIEGWIEEIDYYNGKRKVFRINAKSTTKLPISLQDELYFDFDVQNSNKKDGEFLKELLPQLEKFSSSSPANITINSIIVHSEMLPDLGFVKLNN